MRQKLLDAGLSVLQHEGASALTVRHVSEAAGCSTTGIYTNFGGKNGLIEAIFFDGFESFDDALRPAYDDDDLLRAGLHYREWALRNRMHYLVMFGHAVPEFEPSEPAMERAFKSLSALAAAVERRGVDDPLSKAYYIYATLHGHVMLELVGMGPPEAKDLAEVYESGLRVALAGLI